MLLSPGKPTSSSSPAPPTPAPPRFFLNSINETTLSPERRAGRGPASPPRFLPTHPPSAAQPSQFSRPGFPPPMPPPVPGRSRGPRAWRTTTAKVSQCPRGRRASPRCHPQLPPPEGEASRAGVTTFLGPTASPGLLRESERKEELKRVVCGRKA